MSGRPFRLFIFIAILFTALYFLNEQALVAIKKQPSKKTSLENQQTTSLKVNEEKNILKKPEQIKETQKSNVIYKWKDKNGQLQFSKTPPENMPFSTITYKDSEGTQQSKSTSLRKTPLFTPQEKLSNNSQEKEVQEEKIEVPFRCKAQLRTVKRLEKKLDKADDLVNSIWLQDHCTALSELIQDGCVVPKKQIKYNRYCPVRYKR